MKIHDARSLMHEWVLGPALRTHMECVGACMAAYARTLDPAREELWRVCGLLHDFDYERHPTASEHPVVGAAHLRTLGVEGEVIDAILGHASERTGVARVKPMAIALFAVDELAGFIVACGKVRPDGLASLDAASVQKKLKNKAFAAAVSREDINAGCAELGALTGLAQEAHIARCIGAIREQLAASPA